ncbi:MAG: histidinol-phosphate transaminase [Buchnera aphidicola (Tetraneura akinire)]
MKIIDLVRKSIKDIQPYQSARRIGGSGDIWLNANELPISTLFKENIKNLNRYPPFQSKKLISYYSSYIGCNKDQILVTRGADEGIELLIRAFCEPKIDAIITCPPTYDMYRICAQLFNVENKLCFRLSNWDLNILDIEKKINNVKIIYICNPNNPTGNLIKVNDIKKILEISFDRSLVVIDEAYIEFFPDGSCLSLLSKYTNLVILRTLSKAFGLASIRCGFVISHSEVIRTLSKVIAPYPLPGPVEQIAISSLKKQKIFFMNNYINSLIETRNWLFSELKKCSCVSKVFDSFANFLLVKFNCFELVISFLKKKGIVVRNQTEKYGLQRCIRISIGTRSECLFFLKVIKNIKI